MKIQTAIEELIQKALTPSVLLIKNESDQHSGPPGRESHFHVTVVSEMFNGLTRIKRHQAVYAALKNYMNQPIHALSLHTFTADEWQARGESSQQSPDCASKK